MKLEEVVAKAKTLKQLTQDNETKVLCDLIVSLAAERKPQAGFTIDEES